MSEVKKAIIKLEVGEVMPIRENEVHYDCDFSLFRPIVEQMNELGAPVTLDDLMRLIEGKLKGTIISQPEDKHLAYTLIVHEKKTTES